MLLKTFEDLNKDWGEGDDDTWFESPDTGSSDNKNTGHIDDRFTFTSNGDVEVVSGSRKLGYDENFCRLWKYYLSYCAAGFQDRYLGDLQILMNKSNISTY